jgi:hypothetical protein
MGVGVGEKRRMEMRARLKNTETENKAKESENAWQSLGETPFAGAEQEKSAEKSIEEKRAETEAFSASVREKLATQLGGEDPWKSGEPIEMFIAEKLREDYGKDTKDWRDKSIAEMQTIQDFMLLEEIHAWLPDGSPAEKRITELFHKTYCAEKEDGFAMSLKDNATREEKTQKMIDTSQSLQELDASVEKMTPIFKGSPEDEKASNDINIRKLDLLSFAKTRLGAQSAEYQSLLIDLEDKKRLKEDHRRHWERAPLADCVGSLAGTFVPMRVAAALTAPYGLKQEK